MKYLNYPVYKACHRNKFLKNRLSSFTVQGIMAKFNELDKGVLDLLKSSL